METELTMGTSLPTEYYNSKGKRKIHNLWIILFYKNNLFLFELINLSRCVQVGFIKNGSSIIAALNLDVLYISCYLAVAILFVFIYTGIYVFVALYCMPYICYLVGFMILQVYIFWMIDECVGERKREVDKPTTESMLSQGKHPLRDNESNWLKFYSTSLLLMSGLSFLFLFFCLRVFTNHIRHKYKIYFHGFIWE